MLYIILRIVKKDDFTRHLFNIYDTVYHEGLSQVSLSLSFENRPV